MKRRLPRTTPLYRKKMKWIHPFSTCNYQLISSHSSLDNTKGRSDWIKAFCEGPPLPAQQFLNNRKQPSPFILVDSKWKTGVVASTIYEREKRVPHPCYTSSALIKKTKCACKTRRITPPITGQRLRKETDENKILDIDTKRIYKHEL